MWSNLIAYIYLYLTVALCMCRDFKLENILFDAEKNLKLIGKFISYTYAYSYSYTYVGCALAM